MFSELKVILSNYGSFLFHRFFPLAIVCVVVSAVYQVTQNNEPVLFDEFIKLTNYPVTESPVTLVVIDDQSLYDIEKKMGDRQFNASGWDKNSYLLAFQRINQHKPAVIAFDSIFSRLDPKKDSTFLKQLTQLDNLVVGHAIDYGLFNKTRLPDYYSLNLGVVNMELDNDGVVRRQKPIYEQIHYQLEDGVAGLYPNIALASMLKYLDTMGTKMALNHHTNPVTGWMINMIRQGNQLFLTIFPESNPTKTSKIPINDDGNILLRWFDVQNGKYGQYQLSHYEIPICRVFDACQHGEASLTAQDKTMLKDHIIILGSASIRDRDFHRTPVSKKHLGPDILATTIDNLYFGVSLRDDSKTLYQFCFVGLICITIFYFRFKLERLGPVFLYSFGLMMVYFWIAQQNFERGQVVDVVTPEVFMLLSFAAGSFYREFTKERQVKKLEKNMSQLVSKAVFDEIQKKEFILQAGGDRAEITSLFVDLRNFTSLSEHLPPMEVTEILNEFYTEVERIAFEHNGTIDKFMGDGVLIMFGAPLPSVNQYTDAVSAGKTIIESIDNLIYVWDKEKSISTTLGVHIDIGVSISSGSAFVGFLGPSSKLEFTAVGDCVNLCVRLQEQTKVFNSRLIVSEFTFNGLSAELKSLLTPLGQIRVRGREATLTIYGQLSNRRVIHSKRVV